MYNGAVAAELSYSICGLQVSGRGGQAVCRGGEAVGGACGESVGVAGGATCGLVSADAVNRNKR